MKPDCDNEHVEGVAAILLDDGAYPVPEWHLPIQRCDYCGEFEGDLDAAIAVASARGLSLVGIPSPSGQPYVVQQPWESVLSERMSS